MDSRIQINFDVDPLGTLRVKWNIPGALSKDVIRIHLPSFKFDLPKIGGIPVPLSSNAVSLALPKIKINFKPHHYRLRFKEKKNGNYLLTVKFNEIVNEEIKIQYTIPGIVNNDTIYYVMVYPLINLFNERVRFNVYIAARFSFKIRKYRFREWYFNSKDGRRLKKELIAKTGKTGDLIKVSLENLDLNHNEELDIHLTGTRFPLMVRRDIFWSVLFIISLCILTSPIWTTFFEKCCP